MASREFSADTRGSMSLFDRVLQLNIILIILIILPALVGFAMLYSAAGGEIEPWARQQMIRFAIGTLIMLTAALVDIRFWIKFAYYIYGVALVLLIGVEFAGDSAMGAKRWVSIGLLQLQPAEIMKIALVLALARYFHMTTLQDMKRISTLLPPIILILVPSLLVLRQPDLGTAALLVISGTVILFLAGLKIWKLAIGLSILLGSIPIVWQFLREYQRSRILTFINPESDINLEIFLSL